MSDARTARERMSIHLLYLSRDLNAVYDRKAQ
jgi:hypothetical protein